LQCISIILGPNLVSWDISESAKAAFLLLTVGMILVARMSLMMILATSGHLSAKSASDIIITT
jgi:hypothetical protein